MRIAIGGPRGNLGQQVVPRLLERGPHHHAHPRRMLQGERRRITLLLFCLLRLSWEEIGGFETAQSVRLRLNYYYGGE